jgi:hypothetical protein
MMHPRRITLAAALIAATLTPTVAGADLAAPVIGDTGLSVTDPSGIIASPNVEVVGELPNPGAIGARFRDGVMYVTTSTGLTVYDIADPAAPAEVGRLPLPHFENEDVDLGGDILLISNDAAESTGVLYVIDISDPASPSIRSTLPMGGNPVEGGPGHTASCILDCRFAWVTDGAGIKVIDLRDPDAPVDLGSFDTPAGGGIATHDVQVDGDGYPWVVGFGGAAAYRLPRGYAGEGLGELVLTTDAQGNSTYLTELGVGDGSNPNDYILHNSLRRAGSTTLYVTEEDYTRPGCRGAGSFETWSVDTTGRKKLGAEQSHVLDTWATELLADTAQPAAVCSAHYFDERNGIVAQGWYQQGTRFLDVSDPTDIRQIGYIIPPGSLTWAAYFAPTDPTGRTVYTLDAVYGITVLRLTGPGAGEAPTVSAPILSSWTTPISATAPSSTFGTICLLPT